MMSGMIPRRPHTPKCGGFTLFELVLVIAIIAVLMGLFFTRVWYYQEVAEKTAMEQVVGAVQSALVLQYAQVKTRGQDSDMAGLAFDNPMNWMQKKPRNYAGEFYDATPSSAPSGNWLFDLKSRELIYLVQHTDHFKPGKETRNWIRFHVVLKYEKSALVSLQAAPVELTGVLIEPVEKYVWE